MITAPSGPRVDQLRESLVLRRFWPLAMLAVGLAGGALLRFAVIEPEWIGHLCAAVPAPVWCAPREVAVQAFLHAWVGSAAALAGALVLVFPSPRLLAAAFALGGLALALYNAGGGATGVVLALTAMMSRDHAAAA